MEGSRPPEFGEDLQTPDPGRKLQDQFKIVGAPPVITLLRAIRPVALIADLSNDPARFAPDPFSIDFERPCAGHFQQSSGGASAPGPFFNNPPDSGVFAIVEDFVMRTSASLPNIVVFRLIRAANLANTATAGSQFRDGRLSGTPACGWIGDSIVPVLDLDWQMIIGEPLNRATPTVYTLQPGDQLQFRANNLASTIDISLRWRERSAT